MRIQIDPLCDELQIAADLCEETGDVICASLMRTVANLILDLVEAESDPRNLEMSLVHSSWNAFCDFERQAILQFLRNSCHPNFLKKHGFEIAAQVMGQLRRPLLVCFDSFLFYLLDAKIVSLPQVFESTAFSKRRRIPISNSLIRLGYATEEEIARAHSHFQRVEFVDLLTIEIEASIVEQCHEVVCRDYRVMPIREENDALVFAAASPIDPELADKLRFILNRNVDLVIGTEMGITARIHQAYGAISGETSDQVLMEFSNTVTIVKSTEEEFGDEVSICQPIENATENQISGFRKLWNLFAKNCL